MPNTQTILMHPDTPSPEIEHFIEAICELGCAEVNQLLARAKSGDTIEQLAQFGPAEIRQIITELEQIMAIYNTDITDQSESSLTKMITRD